MTMIDKILSTLGRKLYYRYTYKNQQIQLCKLYSKDNRVLSGIFKGLKYPYLRSFGSSLFPKILGSYEDELLPVWNKVMAKKYEYLLDVGCAEGYYAVGLAKLKPETKVIAYDVDKEAIAFCKLFAQENEVKNITYGSFCDEEELLKYSFAGDSLIISDCEGFECKLFTPKTINHLTNCDVLIEIHDFVAPDLLGHFQNLFKHTHNATVISSRLKSIREYPILDNIDITKYTDAILAERNTKMNWLFLEKK